MVGECGGRRAVLDLLAIGRFARLTGLSVKALRLYDERGILRPAFVDAGSGYRYYLREQVAAAQSIRLLRGVDMPLEDIRGLLRAADVNAARDVLAMHHRRLEQRIAAERRSLAALQRLAARWDAGRKETYVDRAQPTHRCSFCGKRNTEVKRMIAGPKGVFICDACVRLCNQILAEEDVPA